MTVHTITARIEIEVTARGDEPTTLAALFAQVCKESPDALWLMIIESLRKHTTGRPELASHVEAFKKMDIYAPFAMGAR